MSDSPYMDIEDFNLGAGKRVGVKLAYGQRKGEVIFGTIATYDHDKVTGEVTMTVDWDAAPDQKEADDSR